MQVTLAKFLQNFAGKKVHSVYSVVMYEAQLVQKSFSNQTAVYWLRVRIQMTNWTRCEIYVRKSFTKFQIT